MHTHRHLPPRKTQQGVTLVELMVAMLIGLVIIAGVIYVFLGSRQTFRFSDELSRLQENGRIAEAIFNQDIRMAGSIGCGRLGNVLVTGSGAGGLPILTAQTAVTGVPDATIQAALTAAGALAGADTLTIRRISETTTEITSPMGSRDAGTAIVVSANPGLAVSTIALVSDCKEANLFTVSSSTQTRITANESLVQAFQHGTIGALVENTYFLAPSGRVNNLGNAINSLFVRRIDGTIEELIEGVDQLVISYGVDTDANGEIDAYVGQAAVADWGLVRAVSIDALIGSPNDNVLTESQNFVFNGTNVNTINDRRMRTSISLVIALRNRLT